MSALTSLFAEMVRTLHRMYCDKCECKTVHECTADGDYERFTCQVCLTEVEYRVK